MQETPQNADQKAEQLAKFRSALVDEFEAEYRNVLARAPHQFAAFCKRFKERWEKGE